MTPSEYVRSEIQKMLNNGTPLSRIARASGVNRPTLWYWLKNQRPRGMSTEAFDKLCEMLDLKLTRRNP